MSREPADRKVPDGMQVPDGLHAPDGKGSRYFVPATLSMPVVSSSAML